MCGKSGENRLCRILWSRIGGVVRLFEPFRNPFRPLAPPTTSFQNPHPPSPVSLSHGEKGRGGHTGVLEKFIRVGQIVASFGLKGMVKVMPMTDFLERFEKGSKLRLKGEWVEVESFSIHKKRPLLKLSGIRNIAAAEALKWEYLEIPESQKPELDEDEVLSQDLIGLVVVTVDGRELGVVDDIIPMPAHDVIQIGELLIPAVREFVKDIDFDTGIMTVELIPGMLEE